MRDLYGQRDKVCLEREVEKKGTPFSGKEVTVCGRFPPVLDVNEGLENK